MFKKKKEERISVKEFMLLRVSDRNKFVKTLAMMSYICMKFGSVGLV